MLYLRTVLLLPKETFCIPILRYIYLKKTQTHYIGCGGHYINSISFIQRENKSHAALEFKVARIFASNAFQ